MPAKTKDTHRRERSEHELKDREPSLSQTRERYLSSGKRSTRETARAVPRLLAALRGEAYKFFRHEIGKRSFGVTTGFGAVTSRKKHSKVVHCKRAPGEKKISMRKGRKKTENPCRNRSVRQPCVRNVTFIPRTIAEEEASFQEERIVQTSEGSLGQSWAIKSRSVRAER